MEHLLSPSNAQENKIIDYIDNNGKILNNVFYKNTKVVLFEGEEYIVSDNAILTIQETDICNAACKFCFNGITFYPKKTKNNFDSSLTKIIEFCKVAKIESVGISGGEPTLYPKELEDILQQLKGNFKDIRLHSNGYNLLNYTNDDERVVDMLIRNGVEKITLSLAHYDTEINKKLMNFRGKYQGPDEKMFKELGKLSDICSIRLSCFLNKKGVWTADDILNYIEYGTRYNIQRFIFRGASNNTTPHNFLKNTEFVDFGEENIKNIDDYIPLLIKEGFKENFSIHKSDLHVHVLKKNNIIVDLESGTEEIDPDNKIRRLNFFPNGVTYTSWIDPTALLFDKDKHIIINNSIEGVGMFSNHYPGGKLEKHIIERLHKTLKGDFQYPIDLHLHSINSDGKKTVSEVLQAAQKQGVKKLTFTEHNFISENYDEVKKIAKLYGIDIDFPGVEISVITNKNGYPWRKHHLLAYGDKLRDSQFQELIDKPLQAKNMYYANLIENIRKKGINLPDYQDILKGIDDAGNYITPNKKQLTRSVIAKYIQKETGESIADIKQNYLPLISEEISYKNPISAEKIIPIIKELGGVCGLAHPGRVRTFDGISTNQIDNYKDLLEEIRKLRKIGMDGLEVNHKSHTEKTKLILQRYISEMMLLTLGGSDYHGIKKKKSEYFDIYPGTFGLTEDEYLKLYQLL